MHDPSVIPEFIAFDTSHARELLEQIETMRSIDEAVAWDASATSQLQKIASYVRGTVELKARLAAVAQDSREQHSQKPLLKRLFSAPKHANQLELKDAQIASHVAELEELSDRLQTGIDKTPNSVEEQEEMLRELKLLKKGLAQEKRELNEAMRQIRVESRQASSKVGTGLGLFLSTPTTRRLTRMSIRLEKESALKPHESSKVSIERRILVVDRAIHWVERFR